MPTVIVDYDLPVPFDVDELRGQRQDLDVVMATKSDINQRLANSSIFITSNGSWNDGYLSQLEAGDWVQTIGAGYDRFPLEEFEQKEVILTNATGIHGFAASEHVLALVLSFTRRLHEFRDAQHDARWDRRYGTELSGKTLTILGMGNIGEAIAVRAMALGMDVRAIKRHIDAYDGCLDDDELYTPSRIHEVLPETDFFVIVVPLSESTRDFVDQSVLEALPQSAVLINIARGGVVDEKALLEALNTNQIAGAGLDVFQSEPLPESSPLWNHDDIVITPHVAGVSDQYTKRFAEVFFSHFDDWSTGSDPENRIV